MNKFRFTINALAITICMIAFASFAQAQATRTWVSGVGDDVNPCSRTAPCKTFAGAISKTASGGEIDALDPGGFGTVTCTKSITLDGTGTNASILASATNGINVNDSATATPGTIKVRVRALSINGAGTTIGVNGINFTSGSALIVEDTVIDTFSNAGINIPSSTASNILALRNVSIRNCATGVNISNTSSRVSTLSWDNVKILKSAGNGLTAGAGTQGNITRSVIASNAGSGIAASTGTTDLQVSESTISNNSTGIATAASSQVAIARVLITGNTNALSLGGLVHTGGNNTIMRNGTDQDPNGTLFQQK
jgi:hypothetical protein